MTVRAPSHVASTIDSNPGTPSCSLRCPKDQEKKGLGGVTKNGRPKGKRGHQQVRTNQIDRLSASEFTQVARRKLTNKSSLETCTAESEPTFQLP